MLEAIEDDIFELENESEQQYLANESMHDLLTEYNELREASELALHDPRLAAGDTAATLARRLSDDRSGSMDLVKQATTALRAGIDAILAAAETTTAASLKRTRAEYDLLNEIRVEQRSTSTILNEAAFAHLVRQISKDKNVCFGSEVQCTPEAISALQAASEAYLVERFGDSQLAAIHAGRSKIRPVDMQFSRRFCHCFLSAAKKLSCFEVQKN